MLMNHWINECRVPRKSKEDMAISILSFAAHSLCVAIVSLAFFFAPRAFAETHNYLEPQRGMLGSARDHDGYLLLLRSKLLDRTEHPVLASGLWFSAYKPATSIRIVLDQQSQEFTLIGAQARSSLWRSYAYYSLQSGAALRDVMHEEDDAAPPHPSNIRVKRCEVSLPSLLAERTVWLWDTALLNMRTSEQRAESRSDSVRYTISTGIGVGQMIAPRSNTSNGHIRDSLYSLYDLCWNGVNPRRLDELRDDLEDLQGKLSEADYSKGYAWEQIKSSDFAAQMSVYQELRTAQYRDGP